MSDKNDLISRKEALKICRRYWHPTYNPIMEEIEKLPSVQPEILACGEGELNVSDTNVGDMISRQVAIDALDVLCQEHRYRIPGKRETISRQAVVKFFNDWISCLDENCHHQSVADMIIIKNDFKNLPSVQPESKWIPVSERLPDEGQKCLVSDKGAIGIDTYIGHGNPYNWKWCVKDYEAWRPLPEP